MLRILTSVALMAAACLVSCGSPAGDESLEVCELLSEDTVEQFVEDFQVPTSDRHVAPLSGASTFLGCHIGVERFPDFSWGVRASEVIEKPVVTDVVEGWRANGELEEIELDGVRAHLGTTDIDYEGDTRFHVAFESEGMEVLVHGSTLTENGGDGDGRAFIIEAAEEILGNLDGSVPILIQPVDGCPDVDDPVLAEALEGEVLLAGGHDRGPYREFAESLRCFYVSEHTYASLRFDRHRDDEDPPDELEPYETQQIRDLDGVPVKLWSWTGNSTVQAIDDRCVYWTDIRPIAPYDSLSTTLYPSEVDVPDGEIVALREARMASIMEIQMHAKGC